MGMVNTTIVLKPREQWRPGMTFERLQQEMDDALQFPGFPNTWTQPIRNRLDMLFTGIRTPVGIKLLGPDLKVIAQLGREVERVRRRSCRRRAASTPNASRRATSPTSTIDREAIARYGLTVGDVQDVIQSAIGGMNVTRTVEGRERYPVNVRYERAFRDDLPALERVLVKAPGGAQVPLGQLAKITLTEGPAMIRDEDGQLAGYVYVDTGTRDLGGYVERAQRGDRRRREAAGGLHAGVERPVRVPGAGARAADAAHPGRAVSIFVLLYFAFHSASEAVIVMLSVVYAMTGGVLLQWWLGYNFSVAVWVGYIALYGVAVQTGVVMVVYLHEALDRRLRRGAVTAQDMSRGHRSRGRCCGCAPSS